MRLETAYRALIATATIVCLLFASTLADVSFVRLIVHRVAAPPVPASVRERDGRLRIEVRDPTRTPLAKARVTIILVRDGRGYVAGLSETDAQGTAVFASLPRGASWVLVDADHRARTSTQIVVGPEERLIELVSRPEFQLAMRVTGDDQKPVPGAHVLVRCSDPLPFSADSDDEGRIDLGRLCAPPYSIDVNAEGFEPFSRSNVMPGPVPFEVDLHRMGTIFVRVVLADGSPAPLSTIFLSGPGVWPARKTQSTAFGRATIGGVPAGAYDVRAERDDLVSPIVSGVQVKKGDRTKVVLTLQQGRRVTVQVVASTDADAPGIAGADVIVVEGGLSSFPHQGRSAADGTCSIGPFPPGELSASARADGYMSPGAVQVQSDATFAQIVLARAGKLVGDVVDNRGFPVPGASIEVVGTDLSGQPIAETPVTQAFRQAHFAWALPGPPALVPMGELGVMPGPIPPIPHGDNAGFPGRSLGAGFAPWVTDRNGEFAIGPIPPGRVGVIVTHPAYVGTVSGAVTLGPGGEGRLHVVLYGGGTIEGVVLDDRRYPIPGAFVRIGAADGSSERTTITANDGTFAFSAVAQDLMITASAPETPDRVAYEGKIQVGTEERKELEIVLRRERDPIAVTVNDDRGYPIEMAQVTAISLSSDVTLRRTAFSKANGTAKVEDALGLALRVEVSAPGKATVVRTYDAAPSEFTVELRSGLRARGTIIARNGLDRVEGAQVTVFLQTGMQRLRTNDDGQFELGDLNPGTVRLRVDHDDYVAVERTMTIPASADVDRVFEFEAIELQRGGTIEGQVVDDRGDPIAGARVAKDAVPEYLPVGPLPPGVVVTDEKGDFTLHGVPEGDVILEAFAPGIGRGKEDRIAVRVDRVTSRVRVRVEKKDETSGPAVMAGVPVSLRETSSGAGVIVAGVVAGSEAERVGLKTGDVIVRIDGVVPASVLDAQHRLAGPERREVLMEVQRGAETVKLQVPRERLRK